MKIKNKKKHQKSKINLAKILLIIDRIIEHKLFKPVSIAIIVSFLLFYSVGYLNSFIFDYKERSLKITPQDPIKINITDESTDLSLKTVQKMSHIVKSGDTLLSILIDSHTSEEDIFQILSATKKTFNPRMIKANDKVVVFFRVKIDYKKDESGRVRDIEREVLVDKIEISNSVEQKIVVEKDEKGVYRSKIVKIELVKKISKYMGTIDNGLFVDGVQMGASATSVMNMINLYSYDVDFQRDIRSGDKFEILVEEYYSKDGQRLKDGNILYSSLSLRGRKIEIYMYDNKGQIEYFSPEGYSIKKSLLRTPINGARVSSRYGMRRHPVLGYSKMHKGIDFAASRGTPILAAGSGTIIYMARYGSFGNYVKIKHNSIYSTAYAHTQRFNPRFRVGSKVKQGDVIAYVGTTGRSTGPHLHFELLQNGRQINPSTVKITSGAKLTGASLTKFKNKKNEIDGYRKSTKVPEVQSEKSSKNSI